MSNENIVTLELYGPLEAHVITTAIEKYLDVVQQGHRSTDEIEFYALQRITARMLPQIERLAQENEHPHNRPVIVLDEDYFEHLLNAMATQKFLYDVNADGLSEGIEKVKQMQSESQQAIDAAWRKGMDLLHISKKAKEA